ncbi:MAG: PQQ-dependent sugar dehydrogenase [Alphaproteobacteria bacterium]|uniref:PQQ-dependent sugar dehydrogenase n=1 Tax=Candidatus Nitrobium versatile TaxID=2884831 RepID=A0A953M345_9BACT|nr:PQQ-dependent sugar dehydrogenase [Candidatus Nitrobium versatile]
MRLFPVRLFITVMVIIGLSGCYGMRSSSGGGQTSFQPPRTVNSNDIALPEGYQIEPVATGLTFPTGVTFDDAGRIYVVEAGYSYGEVWTIPRLLRIDPGGKTTVIAQGEKNGPWTGVVYHDGAFLVAEGGELEGGRILRISPGGKTAVLVESLPSRGDHHTNGPAVGPDGWIYFGQGVATNSGIVGEDNFKFGWLKRHPDFHDIPCRNIVLNGYNFESKDVLHPGAASPVLTGAFSPFGKKTEQGQAIKGSIPCSGSVMRVRPEGGKPELVAWGFRNPFGLAFSPDGRLFVADNQYDERGSRPVFGTGDLLWEVKSGTWYGWPDYHGRQPLNKGDLYKPQGKARPEFLLAKHPNVPPEPVTIFPVHSSSNGFDFSRNPEFGYTGQAFVAQLGDEAPATGKVLSPVGFKVVRVDVTKGIVHEFAVNKGKTNGPASWLQTGGLERPVAARFNPGGTALYVVDFGVLLHDNKGAVPQKETGILWRITRKR